MKPVTGSTQATPLDVLHWLEENITIHELDVAYNPASNSADFDPSVVHTNLINNKAA